MSKRKPDDTNLMPVLSTPFVETLRQCGVELPEECNTVQIKVPSDGLMQIIYTCTVTGSLAHKIGKALQLQAVKDRLGK